MVRSRWPKPRVAYLGFLLGKGRDAKQIAADPNIQSTPATVHRYVRMMGLAFSDVPRGEYLVTLPARESALLERQASKKRQTPEALASVALKLLAQDESLMDNVLDGES